MSLASNRPAFTLIELMISIAIIGILSAVVFGDFVTQSRRDAIKLAASSVTVDLQKMYTYAQSGRKQGVVTPTLPAGYGLSFVPGATTYPTFFDTAIGSNPALPNPAHDGRYTDESEQLAVRSLPRDVKVDSLAVTGILAPITRLDLVYQIPGSGLAAQAQSSGTWQSTTSSIIIKFRHLKLSNLTTCLSITPVVGVVNTITCP